MTKKEYLLQYRSIDSEIKSYDNEIKKLRELSYKTSGGNMDGMPHSVNGKTEASYTNIVEKIIDMERDRNKKIADLLILKLHIETAIMQVEDLRYRTLLRDKYINGITLEQIAVNMDKSWRHIARMHGQALKKINIL